MIDEKSQKRLECQECVMDGQMYSQAIAQSLCCYGNVDSKIVAKAESTVNNSKITVDEN